MSLLVVAGITTTHSPSYPPSSSSTWEFQTCLVSGILVMMQLWQHVWLYLAIWHDDNRNIIININIKTTQIRKFLLLLLHLLQAGSTAWSWAIKLNSKNFAASFSQIESITVRTKNEEDSFSAFNCWTIGTD